MSELRLASAWSRFSSSTAASTWPVVNATGSGVASVVGGDQFRLCCGQRCPCSGQVTFERVEAIAHGADHAGGCRRDGAELRQFGHRVHLPRRAAQRGCCIQEVRVSGISRGQIRLCSWRNRVGTGYHTGYHGGSHGERSFAGDGLRASNYGRSYGGGGGIRTHGGVTHTRFRGVLLWPLGHATAGNSTGAAVAPFAANESRPSAEDADHVDGDVHRPRDVHLDLSRGGPFEATSDVVVAVP